jgi:ubiquinone/menaquinone biosynthesis C-methylase UbiE
MSKIEALQIKDYWDGKWTGIFDKYQADLRHGFYIASLLNPSINSVLEIGAGSFRDIALLSQLGKIIGAFDFSSTACLLAQKQYPSLADRFWCCDAFAINLKDSAFEASYSNGFIGCFNDKQILKLLEEQVRVTKHQLIATVHNAHNDNFLNYFNQKKLTDTLYDVRFFTISELDCLFSQLPFNYKIYSVGKAYKEHEDILIEKKASIEEIRNCILSQGLSNLTTSERLMVVVDLDK